MYTPGPPRVARSSKFSPLMLYPPPVDQLLVKTACELMLPPLYRRSRSEFQPAYSLKLIMRLRNHRFGWSLRNCIQLPMLRVSARRRNPTSLMSKPGDLNPTFELKCTYSPPILLMAIMAASPESDVRVVSRVAPFRSGRWK